MNFPDLNKQQRAEVHDLIDKVNAKPTPPFEEIDEHLARLIEIAEETKSGNLITHLQGSLEALVHPPFDRFYPKSTLAFAQAQASFLRVLN